MCSLGLGFAGCSWQFEWGRDQKLIVKGDKHWISYEGSLEDNESKSWIVVICGIG